VPWTPFSLFLSSLCGMAPGAKGHHGKKRARPYTKHRDDGRLLRGSRPGKAMRGWYAVHEKQAYLPGLAKEGSLAFLEWKKTQSL